MHGSPVIRESAGLPLERSRIQILARAEVWFEISAIAAPPSQLSYDEYTDLTLRLNPHTLKFNPCLSNLRPISSV